jgi:DNA-binding MarR family transcriptional regulator
MENPSIHELVQKYIDYSFSVTKRAESLIRNEIGDEMTTEQHYTLRYIYNAGTCTSSELADVFNVKKSAITGSINRLVEKGLIIRERDEEDRRIIYLSLSEKGRALYETTQQKIHSLVEQIITKFDEIEIHIFMKTYEKLNEVLNELKDEK